MSKLAEKSPWQQLRRYTPARIALGRVGNALPTGELLRFGLAHAQARDAVHRPFEPDRIVRELQHLGLKSVHVRSAAADRWTYLRRPDLGRRLPGDSRAHLQNYRASMSPDLAIVIADGLSAGAIHAHAAALLAVLLPALLAENWVLAPVVVAEQSRVALGDEIGELLGVQLVAVLIGERPGLSAPDSLGAYLTFAPRVGRQDSERNCISNVRPLGLSYADAARKLLFLMREARRLRLTGVGLKEDSDVPTLAVLPPQSP